MHLAAIWYSNVSFIFKEYLFFRKLLNNFIDFLKEYEVGIGKSTANNILAEHKVAIS